MQAVCNVSRVFQGRKGIRSALLACYRRYRLRRRVYFARAERANALVAAPRVNCALDSSPTALVWAPRTRYRGGFTHEGPIRAPTRESGAFALRMTPPYRALSSQFSSQASIEKLRVLMSSNGRCSLEQTAPATRTQVEFSSLLSLLRLQRQHTGAWSHSQLHTHLSACAGLARTAF